MRIGCTDFETCRLCRHQDFPGSCTHWLSNGRSLYYHFCIDLISLIKIDEIKTKTPGKVVTLPDMMIVKSCVMLHKSIHDVWLVPRNLLWFFTIKQLCKDYQGQGLSNQEMRIVTISWARALSSTSNSNPICMSLPSMCKIQNALQLSLTILHYC